MVFVSDAVAVAVEAIAVIVYRRQRYSGDGVTRRRLTALGASDVTISGALPDADGTRARRTAVGQEKGLYEVLVDAPVAVIVDGVTGAEFVSGLPLRATGAAKAARPVADGSMLPGRAAPLAIS